MTSTEGGDGNTASATLTVRDPVPLIGLNKQISLDGINWFKAVGLTPTANVYYRFTVSNDGETALSGVAVTDPNFPTLCSLNTSLAVGITDSCVVGPQSITAVPTPNPFVNTATATTSTYTPSLPVTSSAEYGTKSITLEKSAGQAYFTAVGNVLTYQYKVTNTGGYPLLGPVSVTDNKVNGVAPNLLSCPDLTGIYLQPGGSVTCTGSYTVTASDVNNQKVENTASATLAGVVSPVDKVTVPLAPDFTASKTNNVSGAVTLGGNFVWTLTVTNSATAGAATFADGQTLLRDDLPSSGAAYSAGTVSGTGTTGTINCDITSNTLTCKANGAVTMPSGASFSVPITVTPSAAVALVNPRTAGVCAADPLDVFPELDDGNNACSDTVTVSNPPILSKPTIAKAFGTSPIAAGGTSTITFTLTNPNATALTGASFSDTLTDMSVNAAGAAGGTCTGAGSNNLTAGQTALSLSGLTLPGSGTNGGVCTVTVVVTSTTSGVHPNTASGVTTTETPTAGTGSNTANLTVLGAPTIAKAFGTSPIAAGGTSTITFTLTNPNATALTGASFSDTLTDMSVNAAGAAGGTCTGAGSNNLTAGQTALSLSGLTLPGSGTNGGVCTVTVVVTSSTSGVHPNTTSGVTTTETPTAGTGSNTANLTVLGADIIAQKNGPALIAANGLITYTVRVSNAGPSAAVGAVVTDPLPEGLSDMLWTCDAAVGGAVCPNPSGNGAISQTIAVFPAGSSLTYTITGTGPASGSVNNQVTITPPQGVTDPNPANNTDSVTTLIGANPSTADLAVFKYGPSTVEANGAITYVILVTNAGYAAANGAVFSDSVPVGFTWTCGNAVGGGVCPNPAGTGAIEETLATFPAGASLTYRVTGSGPASGSVSNTATITAPAVVTDPDLTNNTSSAVTTVGPVSGQADLSLVKTGSLAPGGSVTYTLVVSNAGPNDALNARVVDDLPAALTEVAWNCGNGTGGGSCIDEEDTGDIDTTVNLPVGATVTFTITANTPESGAFVNTAIVIPPAGLVDPDPSNNPSGAVILQLGEIADMAVTLGGLPSEAAPGALVSGTVTCANVGTATARKVTCALTGGTLGVCRVDGELVTLTQPLATLAAGKAIVCDLTATAPASGNLQLIATTDAENDSDPANNQDEVAIPVDLPVPLLPPTLYKAFTPSIIDPGQASTLSITLGNANSSALLLSAALEDTLPTGVTVISPVVLTGTTCTIGSVSTTSGSVSYANGASIPPGGCVIKVQVSATVGGKYVNLLAVGDLQTNGGGNVEPAEAVLYVDPADLAITKTLTTAGPYAAGQVISFTIVGTNNGPDAATGVVITDVPSNLTIQSVSGACTALPCTLGNLAVGSTVSITVVARINAVGNFTNTATITGAQPDPVPANNSASANGQAVDPIPPVAIPTLTELGMILMSLFLLAMARRRMSQGR